MVSVKEIAWLAGILEGEANFTNTNGSPTIRVEMADEDVIQKIALLFKRPYYIRDRRDANWRQYHYVGIYGTPAIEWMYTIFSFMGIRRKHTITLLINSWKAKEIHNSIDFFRCGHPKIASNTYSGGGSKSKYTRCRICTIKRANK